MVSDLIVWVATELVDEIEAKRLRGKGKEEVGQ